MFFAIVKNITLKLQNINNDGSRNICKIKNLLQVNLYKFPVFPGFGIIYFINTANNTTVSNFVFLIFYLTT